MNDRSAMHCDDHGIYRCGLCENAKAANHWRAIEEEKLRKRIAELEADAANLIKAHNEMHTAAQNHIAELEAENARLRVEAAVRLQTVQALTAGETYVFHENKRLREAAKRLLKGIEAYQYGANPPIPLPGIASIANELETLLGGGENG